MFFLRVLEESAYGCSELLLKTMESNTSWLVLTAEEACSPDDRKEAKREGEKGQLRSLYLLQRHSPSDLRHTVLP